MSKATLSSYDQLTTIGDGSVYLYFGPTMPAGREDRQASH
jgi:hypothetical protein